MERRRSLKGLRNDLGISQADAARALGISQPAYCGIEKMDNRELCDKLAKLLRVNNIDIVIRM